MVKHFSERWVSCKGEGAKGDLRIVLRDKMAGWEPFVMQPRSESQGCFFSGPCASAAQGQLCPHKHQRGPRALRSWSSARVFYTDTTATTTSFPRKEMI